MSSSRNTIWPPRDSLADWEGTATKLVAEGSDRSEPRVTIAITTFHRPAMLEEAVRSVLAQDIREPYRISIFDNNPESQGANTLLESLPQLRTSNFRYYVHEQNTGIFGNFNRCLTLNDTEWLTILNDDDLLDTSYLSTMFTALDSDQSTDGIICEKRLLDQRLGDGNLSPTPGSGRRTLSQKIWLVLTNQKWRNLLVEVALNHLIARRKFRDLPTRRIRPQIFFWGALLGNGAGFVFRTAKAIELGGFVPEEFPSSDHFFFTRFAARYHLRQHRAVLASMRIAENESANRKTIMLGTEQAYRLQQLMAGDLVPRWWLRFSPLIIAYFRADALKVWRRDIPAAEIEHGLCLRLPRNRPRLLLLIRLLLRGY